MRLTLITTVIIIVIAVALTLASMQNALNLASGMLVHIEGGARPAGDLITHVTVPDFEGEPGVQEPITISAIPVRQFNKTSIITMIIIIVIGGAVTYLALGHGLKPIKRLSGEIMGISENELSTRVDFEGESKEISHLAASFNSLIDRLENAFVEQRNFSTAAAHELKTPLAVMKTNLDVLYLDQTPSIEDYAEVVAVAAEQTNRMNKLVDDLFNIYMKQDYDFSDDIRLGDLVSDIVNEQNEIFAAKGLNTEIEDNAEGLFTGNTQILRRALGNIIENAGKYNVENGFIKITINETDKEFEIKIADTGVGVPDDSLNDIFEPFYRVDSSRSRKVGGAGLGLAISKNMIQRHGGEISAETIQNSGTVFRIILPR